MNAPSKPFNWQRPPQLRLTLEDEIIVDNFAGGGGASMGIEQAIGRSVDIAINHDPEAIAMHEANHPNTQHLINDVFEINPTEVCQGRPVGLAWFSPDCKHHSKAKGGKPVSKKIRDLAWVAKRWAALVKPRIIMLENVEEFKDWGPLNEDDKPCQLRKGLTFHRFVKEFEKLGYQVEHKILKACDYGAPTIRKRLFLIARCDDQPIVWPTPTHGTEKGLQPYNTAADCINWSLPCHSIFLTKEQAKQQKLNIKRPLAENTLRRIAKGLQRYVIETDEPFIVPSFITEHANGSSQRNMPIDEPLRTICAQVKGGHFALVTAFLAKHYTGVTGSKLKESIGTVTAIDHHSLVTSHLVKLKRNQFAEDMRQPITTLTSGGGHFGEVRAFLVKYYGADQDPRLNEPMHTVTARDRFSLVTVAGQDYKITDIGMRMLSPRELYRAQGFPDQYIINPIHNGKPLTKTAQVRMCGNSVSPVLSKALVEANLNQVTQPLTKEHNHANRCT